MGPDTPTFLPWWKRIGEEYDVRANVGVGGKIYQKYGTTFATRVLVIDKVPPSGRPVVRNEVATAHDLMDVLAGVRHERPIGSAREQVAGEPAGSRPCCINLDLNRALIICPVRSLCQSTGSAGTGTYGGISQWSYLVS